MNWYRGGIWPCGSDRLIRYNVITTRKLHLVSLLLQDLRLGCWYRVLKENHINACLVSEQIRYYDLTFISSPVQGRQVVITVEGVAAVGSTHRTPANPLGFIGIIDK